MTGVLAATRRDGPVQRFRLRSDGPDPVVYVRAMNRDPDAGPATGLSARSVLAPVYLGPGSGDAVPVEVASSGEGPACLRFWEVDPDLMPGVYGLGIPPVLRPIGSGFIMLRFRDAQPLYLELDTVAYDPYDAFALALTTWVRTNCHENLTSGLRKSMPRVLRPLLGEWLDDQWEGE